jgi:hypothetical protein
MLEDHGALAALDHGFKRSPHWHNVQKLHLLKQPGCIVCGFQHTLNVHHKYPFHYVVALGRPDLELDERNLFTLDVLPTEEHHLLIGHLGDYQSFNPNLEQMAATCRHLLASQIRSMPSFIEAEKQRPPRLDKMSQKEKDALRDELDRLFPLEKK